MTFLGLNAVKVSIRSQRIHLGLGGFNLAANDLPSFQVIESLPQFPVERKVIPHTTSLCHADKGHRVEVPKNLEADLSGQISNEVDVEARVQSLDDIGDDGCRQSVEESKSELYNLCQSRHSFGGEQIGRNQLVPFLREIGSAFGFAASHADSSAGVGLAERDAGSLSGREGFRGSSE